jgi:hypothetical protein
LKLQQSISLQSGQSYSSKYEKYGGLNQSINLDGFQPILSLDNSVSSSTKLIKNNNYNNSSLAAKNGSLIINNNNNNINSNSRHLTQYNKSRDLLGQAERGKIGAGSHSNSSECSSNSSVEASVDSNMGLISHERKGD